MINESASDQFIGAMLSSLLFLLIFLVSTYVAKIKGFFSLPFYKYVGKKIAGIYAIINIIFYPLSLLISYFVIAFLFSENTSKMFLLGIMQSCALLLNILFVGLFSLWNKSFPLKDILKDTLFPGKAHIFQDFLSGLKTLLLALFPLLTLMFFFDGILIYLHGEAPPLQEAVKFLIQALKEGIAVIPAIIAITIVAPIMEEYLFRGIIQSYFRGKVGPKKAILISSLAFSLLHYSGSQGIQNIFLLISLFLLSLYLGFIYEKTRSIISNVTLHVTFNIINTIVIIISNV